VKIALYTVNVGAYDSPKSLVTTPYIHYYYFTDDESYTPPKGVNAYYVEPSSNPIVQSRDIKINIHKFLPEFDYYIYIDGNYSIKKGLAELLKEFRIDNVSLWLKKHPKRSNIAEEAKRVKEVKKAEPAKVDEQIEYYKSLGYNIHNNSLYECNVFMRANHPKINAAFEEWFEHVEAFTQRDQLSLPFIINKHNLKPLIFNDYSIRRFFQLHPHATNTVMNIPQLKSYPLPKKTTVHYFTPASSDKNLGRAYNIACESVKDKDDWICLRDGDTMFLTPDFAQQIEAIIEKNGDKFDLISCYTNRLGLKYQLLNGSINNDPNVLNHIRLAFLQRNKFWDEVSPSPSYTAGLFMLFKRSLWDTVKFNDGLTRTKNNIFVDADFSQSVLKKGKKIGLAKGIYLFHLYRIWKEEHRDYGHLL
jgi:hypothetical protein